MKKHITWDQFSELFARNTEDINIDTYINFKRLYSLWNFADYYSIQASDFTIHKLIELLQSYYKIEDGWDINIVYDNEVSAWEVSFNEMHLHEYPENINRSFELVDALWEAYKNKTE